MTENPYEKFNYAHFVTLWKMKWIKTAEAYRLTFKNKWEKALDAQERSEIVENTVEPVETPVKKKPIIKWKRDPKKIAVKK